MPLASETYLRAVPEPIESELQILEAADEDESLQPQATEIIRRYAKLVRQAKKAAGVADTVDSHRDADAAYENDLVAEFGDDKIHQCPVCKKRFRTTLAAGFHREETGHAWHECPLCYRTFATRDECGVHMRTHRDIPAIIADGYKSDRARALALLRTYPGSTPTELDRRCEVRVPYLRGLLRDLRTNNLAIMVGKRRCTPKGDEEPILYPARFVQGEIVIDTRYCNGGNHDHSHD